jgi:FixJ family two-component response regulator
MPSERITIAIVEDDAGFLGATQNLLNAYGFVTSSFTSASEYLNCKNSSEFDCLILDINLGGISGIELCLNLKASGSTIPVVFMTAVADETVREQAVEAGFVAYLRKPFPPGELIASILRAVATRKS